MKETTHFLTWKWFSEANPNLTVCYLWYQRFPGWRSLTRYWRKASDNESSIFWSKECLRIWSSTTSLPNDPKNAPSSMGRQELCSRCLLFLVWSSFSKKLLLSSILASSPKSKLVLLAANFPQPLPPFKHFKEVSWELISNLLLPLLARQQETAKAATSLLGCGGISQPG